MLVSSHITNKVKMLSASTSPSIEAMKSKMIR